MTRGLPPLIVNTLSDQAVQPFFAIELLFDSPNELYLWTGIGDLVIDGVTYTGTGDMMQVSEIQETTDISARGASLTLSGITSDILDLVYAEDYQGRTAKILFGLTGEGLGVGSVLALNEATTDRLLLDDAGTFLDISSPSLSELFELFVGTMDQITVDEGPQTSVISLTIESKLIDLERPRFRRYTDANQQGRFTGDLAFEFVTRLQGESLDWGP